MPAVGKGGLTMGAARRVAAGLPVPSNAVLTLPAPVAAAVAEAKGRLVSQFGERLHDVRVFGSHARGTAHAGSDVDVLVVLDAVSSVADRHNAMILVIDAGLERDLLLEPHVLGVAEFTLQVRCKTSLADQWQRVAVVV